MWLQNKGERGKLKTCASEGRMSDIACKAIHEFACKSTMPAASRQV